MIDIHFDTGPIVMTRSVADRCVEDQCFCDLVSRALAMHVSGNWGDLCDEDWASNNEAVRTGDDRILSAYNIGDGTKIWIITEWDRSATTILFPEEY